MRKATGHTWPTVLIMLALGTFLLIDGDGKVSGLYAGICYGLVLAALIDWYVARTMKRKFGAVQRWRPEDK